MTTRRQLSLLRRGQSVRDLRQPINSLIEQVNKTTSLLGGAQTPLADKPPKQLLLIEIKTLNAANLTCVVPGQSAAPEAFEYTVELPQTFNESNREGVTYVYTNINNRTADGTEQQRLTPTYVVGDLIMVASFTEGTGYIDINIDGRQWAKLP